MLEQIKNNLFTIHGFLTSMLHIMLIVGILASWIFVRVEVMGDDVAMSFPSTTAMKGKLGR